MGRVPGAQLAHPASDRLAHRHHQQREQHAGKADREEHDLPGANGAEDRHRPRALLGDQSDHHAAQQEREPRPDVDADGVDRERGRQLSRRKVVGDHRVRRRRQRRLADADAEAQQEEVPVLPSEAAARGHQAPGEETGGDQAAAAPRVGEPAERQPEEGVEEREAEPHEQAHLRVRDAEVAADRPHQETQDLAIDEREDVDHHQHADHVPGVADGWVRSRRRAATRRGSRWKRRAVEDAVDSRRASVNRPPFSEWTARALYPRTLRAAATFHSLRQWCLPFAPLARYWRRGRRGAIGASRRRRSESRGSRWSCRACSSCAPRLDSGSSTRDGTDTTRRA